MIVLQDVVKLDNLGHNRPRLGGQASPVGLFADLGCCSTIGGV
jgi:hypothetical protein